MQVEYTDESGNPLCFQHAVLAAQDGEDIRAMQQLNQSEFVDKMIEEFFENDEEEQNDWRKA